MSILLKKECCCGSVIGCDQSPTGCIGCSSTLAVSIDVGDSLVATCPSGTARTAQITNMVVNLVVAQVGDSCRWSSISSIDIDGLLTFWNSSGSIVYQCDDLKTSGSAFDMRCEFYSWVPENHWGFEVSTGWIWPFGGTSCSAPSLWSCGSLIFLWSGRFIKPNIAACPLAPLGNYTLEGRSAVFGFQNFPDDGTVTADVS